MLKWRLTMERMKVWCQTQCISKYIHPGFVLFLFRCTFTVKPDLFSPLQQHPEEDSTLCNVLWISVSVFWELFLRTLSLPNDVDVCLIFSSSVFGVILILVDFVLVIVDLSLPAKSREVGDILEAVSLIISFFFLADVLLRVYVEG